MGDSSRRRGIVLGDGRQKMEDGRREEGEGGCRREKGEGGRREKEEKRREKGDVEWKKVEKGDGRWGLGEGKWQTKYWRREKGDFFKESKTYTGRN
jgi:hypothetical protein